MLPTTRDVVSRKWFDQLFREEACIAEFATAEDEVAYERRDSFLIHLIHREVERHFGPDEDLQPYVLEDWWPDHTRHMDAVPAQCTAAFLTALCDLLTDEFADYRIQVCVYEDAMNGETFIGSMALYADRVLIEEKLHDRLQQSQGS